VVVYTAERTGGDFVAADEALEGRLFAPRAIPWAELAFPSTFEALRDYLQRAHGLEPPPGSVPPVLP
jgi:hypothetical protein